MARVGLRTKGLESEGLHSFDYRKKEICRSLIPWGRELFSGFGCTSAAAVLLQSISAPALLTVPATSFFLPFSKSTNALSNNIGEEKRKSDY